METTLEIPDPLFQLVQQRAGQRGVTVQEVIVLSLEHAMHAAHIEAAPPPVSKRKLRPEFQRMWESGELSGGTDSTIIISESRDSR